jgi:hypothetical protein
MALTERFRGIRKGLGREIVLARWQVCLLSYPCCLGISFTYHHCSLLLLKVKARDRVYRSQTSDACHGTERYPIR